MKVTFNQEEKKRLAEVERKKAMMQQLIHGGDLMCKTWESPIHLPKLEIIDQRLPEIENERNEATVVSMVPRSLTNAA